MTRICLYFQTFTQRKVFEFDFRLAYKKVISCINFFQWDTAERIWGASLREMGAHICASLSAAFLSHKSYLLFLWIIAKRIKCNFSSTAKRRSIFKNLLKNLRLSLTKSTQLQKQSFCFSVSCTDFKVVYRIIIVKVRRLSKVRKKSQSSKSCSAS